MHEFSSSPHDTLESEPVSVAASTPIHREGARNTASLSVAEGREAGMRLAGLPGAHRPTAAFCVNDLIALGLLQQAITSGTRVPKQLAIVGYDDIDFAAAAAVPLTSVRQPRQQLGRTAAELVLAEATDVDHQHQQVLFTPELVARTSTLG